jgi:DNA-binding NtrC family response regulator
MGETTLWLVEDEASIADTLIYTLQQEGFRVRGFERGLPVLRRLQKQRLLQAGDVQQIGQFELNEMAAQIFCCWRLRSISALTPPGC